jgi:transcriptional regulator with GAF, ATPase, and Fis domain
VLSVAKSADEAGVDCKPERRAKVDDPVFTMKALQDLSQRIHQADSLDGLLDSILEGLDEFFGFTHSMILLPGEDEGVLVTVATRGYSEGGVGAEVRIGEGIIGVVAEQNRISG